MRGTMMSCSTQRRQPFPAQRPAAAAVLPSGGAQATPLEPLDHQLLWAAVVSLQGLAHEHVHLAASSCLTASRRVVPARVLPMAATHLILKVRTAPPFTEDESQ